MLRQFQEWMEQEMEKGGKNVCTFLVWGLIGVITGVFVGAVGIGFHILLEMATEIRMQHPWLLFLLPVGGLMILGWYRLLRVHHDRGTNLILMAVRSNEVLPLKMTPLIFFSTVLTHLLGGSAGREGAALQIGGSMAAWLGRTIRLNEKEERMITMCGMSAGFAALFGTPIAAVVFSMEVITVGVMHYSAMVPCVISALVATGLSSVCGIAPTTFSLHWIPTLSVQGASAVLLLGALCAAVSILFCLTMEVVSRGYRRYLKNEFIRIFVGGCLVIACSLLIGTRDYNGAGMDVIVRAIDGEAAYSAFLLKILLTALTLGAGYKGGEIVPSFFVGATFGCVVGPWIGLPASFSAGLGLAGVFCGVTNCPLATMILSVELFGADGIGYFALVCAVSYMLSGYYGLYAEQKIMYSKTQPEFINKTIQ